MLNRLRAFRERGWREVDAPTYAQAWQRFGGSVATHPLVVEQLAEMAGIPVRYLGWESAGELVAAIPTWGRHLALSKDVLKRRGKKGLYDLGNAELILPVAGDARIALRHAGRYLSALHERNIVTLRPQTEQLAFARAPEDFSKKFRYNQRREVRLVEEAGGQVRQADSFAPAEFAAIYLELFQRRWGFLPPARSAWPRSSSGCANCCAARSCCSTTSPSRSRYCIAPKRRAGSASSTSTAASIRRPASSALAACSVT